MNEYVYYACIYVGKRLGIMDVQLIALFMVDEQAKSVSQAESMITKHNEHKVRHIVL